MPSIGIHSETERVEHQASLEHIYEYGFAWLRLGAWRSGFLSTLFFYYPNLHGVHCSGTCICYRVFSLYVHTVTQKKYAKLHLSTRILSFS